MTMRDNKWLHAEPTTITDAWFVTLHGGYAGQGEPDMAKLYWPEGRPLTIPSKMVLMTVAAFADLQYRAALADGEQARPAKEGSDA